MYSCVRGSDLASVSTEEEFEDTKGVMRICTSKNNTMAKRKSKKKTNNDLQNIYIKLMVE